MPAQPSWHARVPEMIAQLNAPSCPPVLGRPAFETLFGVRRRQAIRLLEAAGGYQVGKTFLVERQALIGFLERVQSSGSVARARTRRDRIVAALSSAPRRRVAEHVSIARTPASSAAVRRLGEGRVEISYRGAEDLLAQLVELATLAADDYPRFQEMFGQ